MRSDAFYGITDITIYVEASEKDVLWDLNYPGWNNGNKVVYGEEWITAAFYDQHSNLISSEFFLTSQVIRQPYLELADGLEESQVLVGWDIDGDGMPDTIPATSTVDIVARPIIETRASEYTVDFLDSDGVTLISKVILPYGAAIVPPVIEEKTGYTTKGWIGYVEGMTVSGHHTFVLDREHNGDGHENNVPVWVAPTCTEEGYNKHICQICGEWYATDYVEPMGHDYSVTEKPATCTEEGMITYTCKNCNDTYAEVIPPKGHEYVRSLLHQATCTEQGEMLYSCKICGYRIIEKTLPAAHNYQKKTASERWLEILIKQISNVFFGYEGDNIYYYECIDCKRIQTAEESNATGGSAGIQSTVCVHQLGDWREYMAPTCMGDGVETRICSVCEKAIEFRRGESAISHDYKAVVITPTCTEKGYTAHTCSLCGDTYTESEVAELGHTAGAAADCVNDQTCTVCGEVLTKKLGHKPGTKADCLNDQVCTVCGAVLKEKLGHNYKAAVTAPSCTEKGYTTHTCSRCKDTYTDRETPALGHVKGAEADCFNDQVCTVCGEVFAEKLGHDYVDVVTKPTCTENGYTTHTCSRCGDNYTDSEVAEIGHTASEWIVDKEPAPGIEGSQHKECTVCDETLETAVIEALPVETELETETSIETEAPSESETPTEAGSKQEEPIVSNGCFGIVSADIFCLILLMSFASLIFVKRREENC